MLDKFYGLDEKVFFVRGKNRTLTFKRKLVDAVSKLSDAEIYNMLHQVNINTTTV